MAVREGIASIRNFCIIAHIDHGKSTLADRFLEVTSTVARNKLKAQHLDSLDLERERGITIKLQPARLEWKGHQLNLIDTPGHIDFSYEVSRSLAAVEGALLLVDATQGIQAQTLANLYLALAQNLTIIPAVNKIDAPAAQTDETVRQLTDLLGCDDGDVLRVSGKTGQGVEAILDAVIDRVPAPSSESSTANRALIFDAHYDEFRGVVIYLRVMNGSFAKGENIHFLKSSAGGTILDCGYFSPEMKSTNHISEGEIGFIVSSVKDINLTKVGDTIASSASASALTGYKEVSPVVYAGFYPDRGEAYEKLRSAVDELKLNDSSVECIPDHSDVLGFGFRCGFLGLLHLEIFQERLRREHGLETIVTSPTVAYAVTLTSGSAVTVTSPSQYPEQSSIARVKQPMATIELLTPRQFMGAVMNYLRDREAEFQHTEFLQSDRILIRARLPLSSIIVDFYDTIKNISSGYASYTYEVSGMEECDVVRLDVLVAEQIAPGLSVIIQRNHAERVGRDIVTRLKNILPREQFVIKIQAAVGGKIVAAERLSALHKDVTAKLYGGDVTRKRKLLEKQKKGKRKLATGGDVQIPHSAYVALMKREL